MTRHTTVITFAFVAVACLAFSNARFLETTTTATSSTPSVTPYPSFYPLNVTYASNLSCGLCTAGGYVFCVTGNDNQVAAALPATTAQFCCRNSTNCTYANNTAYTCSSSYADPSYAQMTCPISQNLCGKTQSVKFTAIGNTTNLTITGLTAGNTCVYRVDATCGAPAFYTSNVSNALVGYIYYEGQDIDLNGTVVTGKTSIDSTKMTAPPAASYPRRNQTVYVEDGYLPNPKIVKGIYNVAVGGTKAYGNSVQGSGALAYKLNSASGACVANRTMLISVTAQTTITSMTLSLSSANFTSTELVTKPTKPTDGDGGDGDGSNAMTLSGFLSITLMSIFYMLY